MTGWLGRNGGSAGGAGRGEELREAIRGLDPAASDPNYWLRFRSWVMSEASRELARRRLLAQLTVGDVMSSWARTLVPAAALAAAIAGMLLARSAPVPGPQDIGLEELLVSEIPGETVPLLLEPEGSGGVVAFAAEIF